MQRSKRKRKPGTVVLDSWTKPIVLKQKQPEPEVRIYYLSDEELQKYKNLPLPVEEPPRKIIF